MTQHDQKSEANAVQEQSKDGEEGGSEERLFMDLLIAGGVCVCSLIIQRGPVQSGRKDEEREGPTRKQEESKERTEDR